MLFSVLIVFIVCAVPFQVIKIYYLYTQGNRGYKVCNFILDAYKDKIEGVFKYDATSFTHVFKDMLRQHSIRLSLERTICRL